MRGEEVEMRHRRSGREARAARWALALALLLGLAVRIAYQAELRHAPDWDSPGVDAAYHDDWARRIGDRDWEGRPNVPDPEIDRHAWLRPPGYPLLLGALYRLFGPSYAVPRVLGVVVGLATVALAWALGRRAGGAWGGGFAAFALTLHWPAIYFEGELHAEPLAAALLAGGLLALLKTADRPGARRGVLAGLLLGLATITRTNALLGALVGLGWLAVVLRRRAGRGRALAAVLLGLALPILPCAWRNHRVCGEWIPVSANLGINLYIGNHDGATPFVAQEIEGLGAFGTCYDWPGLLRALEERLGRPVSDGEADRWFRDRALEWIARNPGAFLTLCGRKLLLLLGPLEVSHNKVVELEREHSRVLRVLPRQFPLWLALAPLAVVLAFPRRRGGRDDAERGGEGDEGRTVLLLALAAAAWIGSIVPFFVAGRYRLPAAPLLAALAGAGVAALVREVRARRLGRAALFGGGAAALLAATSHAWVRAPLNAVKWHTDRGKAWNRKGRPERAREEFEAALALVPGDPDVLFSLGYTELGLGREEEALRRFEQALALDPDHPRALQNAGVLLARRGRFAAAIERFRRLTRLEPSSVEAWRNLGLALDRAGRASEALAAYRRALALSPADAPLRRRVAELERSGGEDGR